MMINVTLSFIWVVIYFMEQVCTPWQKVIHLYFDILMKYLCDKRYIKRIVANIINIENELEDNSTIHLEAVIVKNQLSCLELFTCI